MKLNKFTAFGLGISMLVAASGCSGGGSAHVLRIKASGSGDSFSYSGSEAIEAGLAEIRFKNSTDKPRSLQLIRLEGNHSIGEALNAIKATDQGKGVPDWLGGAGGVGTTPPGETRIASVNLAEGNYYFTDPEPIDDKNPNSKTYAELGLQMHLGVAAANGEKAVLPKADFSVTAKEYEFNIPVMSPGLNTIEFKNEGKENHHFVAFPLKPGSTVEDLKTFLSSDKPSGPPPADMDKSVEVAVIDGGHSQVTQLDLKPGFYGFVCFINDRAGGPPHFTKGMAKEQRVSA